jgi:hypothetical protein
MVGSSHAPSSSHRRHGAAQLAILATLAMVGPAAHAQSIPTDAKATCTVTPAQFKGWFASGSVTLNGVVNPANSVAFTNATNNCIFYQWSEQMFLWLTSPAPETYGGGGGRIIDSPTFYDVSPPDASGRRTFIPHTPGFIRALGVRAAQVGPNGLPVVFDTAGRMVEVQPATTVAPAIRSSTGTAIEIGSARIGANNKPVLLDKSGAEIKLAVRKAVVRPGAILTAQQFVINGIPILIDPAGNVIDVEQGQAGGGGVLMSQSKSLIYYATIVNDVYAYFLTGVKDGKILPATAPFPTTQAALNQITTFAANAPPPNKKTFPDPNALTIEVKSSWIEAAGLPNASSYITMNATIPTYDTANPNQWTVNGQKTVQLALLGMHVVGGVNGHPEMVWATFEHFGNSPNGAYSYVASNGQTKQVAQSTAGSWLFTKTSSAGPFNILHMFEPANTTNIVPVTSPPPPQTISPSDTIRWHAFGAASNVKPNPLDASTAASNSELISINHSIASMMPSGDVRDNYFMLGATWTELGAAPTSQFPAGNEVGTSVLSNSTMETYQQGTSNSNVGAANCFDCHRTNTTGVSHIFGTATTGLKPLF